MSLDFDEFPIYDPIVKEDGKYLAPDWQSFISTFKQNLSQYLTANGIIPPYFTTTQRNDIKKPQLGAHIYNTTLNKAQYYNGTTWVSYP